MWYAPDHSPPYHLPLHPLLLAQGKRLSLWAVVVPQEHQKTSHQQSGHVFAANVTLPDTMPAPVGNKLSFTTSLSLSLAPPTLSVYSLSCMHCLKKEHF